MRERIIALRSPRCHGFLEGLVGGELESGEGYCHRESGRVRNVEGAQAFGSEHVARAFGDGAVGGAVELHALFDDIEGVHEGVAGDGGAGAAGGCVGSQPGLDIAAQICCI